jgi:hypothetical protein
MIFDTQKVLTIVIEAASFIAALASIAAGVIMAGVTKKFGTGILASGFKVISIGVLFIAAAIIIDAIESYLEVVSPTVTSLNLILLVIKAPLFLIGTYLIVIGSKKTGDKLESLTK